MTSPRPWLGWLSALASSVLTSTALVLTSSAAGAGEVFLLGVEGPTTCTPVDKSLLVVTRVGSSSVPDFILNDWGLRSGDTPWCLMGGWREVGNPCSGTSEIVDETALYWSGESYSFQGLPPGMTSTPAQGVTGVATTPGLYQVRGTAYSTRMTTECLPCVDASSHACGVWNWPIGPEYMVSTTHTAMDPVASFSFQILVTDLAVDSLEVSQAIQQSMTPGELYGWLDSQPPEPLAIGDLPVPLVAGKPGYLRIYLKEVAHPLVARVRVWVKRVTDPPDGWAEYSQSVRVLPGCSPREARLYLQSSGHWCSSVDFYWPASQFGEGDYDLFVGLEQLEPWPSGATRIGGDLTAGCPYPPQFPDPRGSPWGSAMVLRENAIWDCRFPPIRVNRTDDVVLHPISVCHDPLNRPVGCGDVREIGAMSQLFQHVAPTGRVRFSGSGRFLSIPLLPAESGDAWWARLNSALAAEATTRLPRGDAGARHILYGVVSPDAPGEEIGGKATLLGASAASRSSVERLGAEANVGVMAHELGHVFGLTHTNTNDPLSQDRPGCWGLARQLNCAPPWKCWPYSNVDNRLRSGDPLEMKTEIGLDFTRNRVRGAENGEPDLSFEMMGYCAPRWVTPWSYTGMLEGLIGQPTLAAAIAEVEGTFDQISGSLPPTGDVQLEPIFRLHTIADGTEGVGTHGLELRDAAGNVLQRRRFTPRVSATDTTGDDVFDEPYFSELVPARPEATTLAVIDAGGSEVGRIALGGTAPAVTIRFPEGGESLSGVQTIRWDVTDADGPSHLDRVEYSPDSGTTWVPLAPSVEGPELPVDFDQLPGAAGTGVIRVYASDGVNSGAATSSPFSVARKPVEALVLGPENDAVLLVGEILTLEGSGFDPDDGVLVGDALTWTSASLGPLGTGSPGRFGPLEEAQIGSHVVSLTVRDSDGNTASRSVSIRVEPKPAPVFPGAPVRADAGSGYRGEEGSPVGFYGSASYAWDGAPLVYEWQFGDGSSGSGPFPDHTYVDDGQYAVSLEVTDERGATDVGAASAVVANAPPKVSAVSARIAAVGAATTLAASFSDAGANDGPWRVEWSFGDGTAPVVSSATSQGPIPGTHAYASTGSYTATVSVRDKDGGVATAQVAVGSRVWGDIDQDGDVDSNDLPTIIGGRNQSVLMADDMRDVDRDGRITLLDARKLVLLCTRPRCATQ